MVTKGYVPDKLFMALNSSDVEPLDGWFYQKGLGEVSTIEDDILRKTVVCIESREYENSCVSVCRPFFSNPANLSCLCILIRTFPNQHFAFSVEMAIEPWEGGGEQTKKLFVLTTDKRKTSNGKPRHDHMKPGWNYVVLQLAEICSQFYQSNYVNIVSLTVNADCRLYRVFLADRFYHNDELPEGYRLSTYDSPTIATIAE